MMIKPATLSLILACAALPVSAAEHCETNFTKEGRLLKGTTFKTWGSADATSATDAYKKIYLYLAKDGWKITSSDKDLGIISAAQDVSYGEGKTAPLNVVVESLDAGSKISLTFSTSGGVVSPAKAVQEGFCKMIAAAAKN